MSPEAKSVGAARRDWGDDDDVDLTLLLKRIWSKKWWVVLCVVVCATALTVASLLMTPIYRASTVLISASSERSGLTGSLTSALGQLGGLASFAGVSAGSGDSSAEEALAVLRSKQFTEEFIDQEQLMPKLYGKKMHSTPAPTLAKAFKLFDDKVRTVIQDKKSGLLTLQIDWKDRQLAADWANMLVQKLNFEMRERAIAKATASIGYLQKELGNTTEIGTREAINRLVETQVNQRMLADVNQEYAFRVVDKALAPDSDDIVKPKKWLFLAAGMFLGLMLGVLVATLLAREDP